MKNSNRGWLSFLLIAASGLSAQMASAQVDFTTLSNKVMAGYQGWHWAKGDGSPYNNWNHWIRTTSSNPGPANCHMDMYPDMTEYTKQYVSGYQTPDGTPLTLYSAADYSTVDLHFKWMRDYNIDGAFVQRFISRFKTYTTWSENTDIVLSNCWKAAETYGRAFVVMYDVSNSWDNDAQLYDTITYDWINRAAVYTNSPNYLFHKGKPLVVVWGMGKSDRAPTSPKVALDVVNFFKTNDCTIMGGVDNDWRTLGSGCRVNVDQGVSWSNVNNAYDIISPWHVGTFSNPDDNKTKLSGDVLNCNSRNVDYMPVAWPGFSWSNWQPGTTFNDRARLGGTFLWKQAYNSKIAGANMLYLAMFDEVDEATALYKTTTTASNSPRVIYTTGYTNRWVRLDIDGYNLPSDWHLQVCNEINKMFKGVTTTSDRLPILPEGYPPIVTLSGAPVGNITNTPFTVTLNVNVNTGYCSLNGGVSYTTFTTNSPAQIYIGSNMTIRYYGRNSKGVSPTTNVSFIVDSRPPVIGITGGPATDTTFDSPFNVTLQTDEPSGYCLVNGSLITQFLSSCSISISNTTALAYYAQDAWGNNSETNTVRYTLQKSYAEWVAGLGVDIGSASDDYDGDGKINLYEYALGGDPTNSLITGTTPVFVLNPPVGGYTYSYTKRKDNTNLTYNLFGCENLITGPWITNGINYYQTIFGTNFDTVYYIIPTNRTQRFIQLKLTLP